MHEEFEGLDLRNAVFWGVDLRDALFRDANLSGASLRQVRLVDVNIDGLVDRLVINGVDVTAHVNAGDRWYPVRTMLTGRDAASLVEAWDLLQTMWSDLDARVARLGSDAANTSVEGEWSYCDTLRHLLFVMDKWFRVPLLGESGFAAIGLPNSGSADGDWPGLERGADPDMATVDELRRAYADTFRRHLADVDVEALPDPVEVPENGPVSGLECLHVVLEEEFEHLRYATRDLEALEERAA